MGAKNVPLNEVVHIGATTRSPTTRAEANASAIDFNVYEEDTDVAILSGQTMTLRVGTTGVYRGQFAVTTANGFEEHKWYHAITHAVVETVPDNALLLTFFVIRSDEGYRTY